MRPVTKESRSVWLANYSGKVQARDSQNRLTGAWRVAYANPVEYTATVGPASGNTFQDGFGMGVEYDRVMNVYATGTGITENSAVWAFCEPALNEDGSIKYGADGEMATGCDYTIASVAEYPNMTSVALRKRQ